MEALLPEPSGGTVESQKPKSLEPNSPERFPIRYDFRQAEERWSEYWREHRSFHSEPDSERLKYTMVIPPPNVTGYLHLGHALDNTYQDLMARWKRQLGYNVCWIPGTDHAGIATQNVVERSLHQEGSSRTQLGRKEFLKRVWEWKHSRGHRIIEQLKRIGCSCDWEREHFTMEPEFSAWVKKTFHRLYEKGVIYRGHYPVNWCPRCETALANDEVEHQEQEGTLYYLRYYSMEDPSRYLVVATTRPETIFGDVAVAFHPSDERYRDWEGKKVQVPGTKREIPVIADIYPKPEFGTGLVKITPAHDKNDYLVGKRHSLAEPCILDTQGRLQQTETPYDGQDRFQVRKDLIADLKKSDLKLVDREEPYTNQVGTCYRCHTITEINLSPQWFVKMQEMADRALEMVASEQVKLFPAYQEKIFRHWLTECEDWCISRQIWWGHPIPVSYCHHCDQVHLEPLSETRRCECGSEESTPDPDVLDTWFSSWLWPFAVFNEEERGYYFPVDLLVTGSDILFFWVARMMMASGELMESHPFERVFLHGIVRDETGEKMSKSKGNAIDPLEIIDRVGADAMRYTLVSLTAYGGDTKISADSFELGATLCTKMWNAVRFIVLKIPAPVSLELPLEKLDYLDRWILVKAHQVRAQYEQDLHRCHFAEAMGRLKHFFWEELCNGYLEMCKFRIDQISTQQVLLKVLRDSLLMFHPIMPFITEELWTLTNALVQEETPETITQAQKPESLPTIESWSAELSWYDPLWELVKQIRSFKSQYFASSGQPQGMMILVPVTPEGQERFKLVPRALQLLRQMTRTRALLWSDSELDEFSAQRSFERTLPESGLAMILLDDGQLNFDQILKQLDQKINGAEKSCEKTKLLLPTLKNPKKRAKMEKKLQEAEQKLLQLAEEKKRYA